MLSVTGDSKRAKQELTVNVDFCRLTKVVNKWYIKNESQ